MREDDGGGAKGDLDFLRLIMLHLQAGRQAEEENHKSLGEACSLAESATEGLCAAFVAALGKQQYNMNASFGVSVFLSVF